MTACRGSQFGRCIGAPILRRGGPRRGGPNRGGRAKAGDRKALVAPVVRLFRVAAMLYRGVANELSWECRTMRTSLVAALFACFLVVSPRRGGSNAADCGRPAYRRSEESGRRVRARARLCGPGTVRPADAQSGGHVAREGHGRLPAFQEHARSSPQ